MRTIEQIQAEINAIRFDGFDARDQGDHWKDGFHSGLTLGLALTQQGKTSDDIFADAQATASGYNSHGDDMEDAWQSGYTAALYWCAEQYDWDSEGKPIFRAGNKLGEPAN
jgi:hypothetical protein